MMRRQTRRPSPFLQDYISQFELRDLVILETRGVRPLPARPAQFLIFHLADISGCDLLDHRTGEIVATPPVGIQGPQSFRAADALWKGRFRDFAVAFRPTGFHRLFGIPMNELTDRVVEASQLLGAGVRQLHECLQGAAGLDAMALLTEDFFRGWLPRAHPFHPVQVAASQVIARHGGVTIDDLARAVNLSGRQLERRFVEQVGIPPNVLPDQPSRLCPPPEGGDTPAHVDRADVSRGLFRSESHGQGFPSACGNLSFGVLPADRGRIQARAHRGHSRHVGFLLGSSDSAVAESR